MQRPSFLHPPLIDAAPCPFPPGLRWKSVRSMLHEVMQDMHREWVQQHLVKPNPHVSMTVLCSADQVGRTPSLSCFEGKGVRAVLSTTALFVPRFTREDISAGVTVTAQRALPSPLGALYRARRLGHYVCNKRTGALCAVSVNANAAVVEVTYITLTSISSSRYIQLRFNAPSFFEAFGPGSIDFSKLEKGLLSSIVGYGAHQKGPCTCLVSSCIDCFGGSACRPCLPVDGSVLDFVDTVDYVFKGAISYYWNGSLISASPFSDDRRRSLEASHNAKAHLVSWAMTDLLNQLLPTAPVPKLMEPARATAQDEVVHDSACLCQACASFVLVSTVPSVAPKQHRLRPIAPAVVQKPQDETVPDEEKDKREWLKKVEARKIRNRMAAMRSSAKRRERRRIGQLARLSANSPNTRRKEISRASAAMDLVQQGIDAPVTTSSGCFDFSILEGDGSISSAR